MSESPDSSRSLDPIPLTLRIGVTGHRKLDNPGLIRDKVIEILHRLDDALGATPHDFVAISALAEGADQIVAECILAHEPRPGSGGKYRLDAVLPMPREEYSRTMETEEGRGGFGRILALAQFPDPPIVKGLSDDPYGPVGRHVVDHCDILIAVWDGELARGKGGTQQIVEHAAKMQRFIYHIHSRTGEVRILHPSAPHEESQTERRRRAPSLAMQLDLYNREAAVGPESLQRGIAREMSALGRHAGAAGLGGGELEFLRPAIMPHFVQADLLAGHYQFWQRVTGLSVYVLAFAAVTLLAFQHVWFHGLWALALGEGIALVLIIGLMHLEERREFHRKWIDYRFLAERIRAGIFMRFVPGSAKWNALSDDDPKVDWTDVAIRWIERQLMPSPPPAEEPAKKSQDPGNAPSAGIMRAFVANAWIGDQMNYYEKKAARYGKRHHMLHLCGVGSFGLALMACIVHIRIGVLLAHSDHASSSGGGISAKSEFVDVLRALENVTVILGLLLPAIGSALAGIKNFFDHQRIAERYRYMALRLYTITSRVGDAESLEELRRDADEAFRVMMSENQDWRVDVAYRKADPA